MTPKGYRRGTHRVVAPEVTLERIHPHLARWGVTRLADVTGLDHLAIPTYCAIRPTAMTLQVSHGKGLRPIDAQVSALMETIELAHLESEPAAPLELASLEEIVARGEPSSFDVPDYMRPRRPPIGRFEWVLGVELCSQARFWVPASAAWIRPRQIIGYSSHGLASGNTLVEATLHALYEVLERHILSGLVQGGRLDFSCAQTLSASDAGDDAVRELAARIESSGVKLVLIHVGSELALHTFMAVLLDPDPFCGASAVNVGYGAHLSPAVAATRAITEAAQSRLTFIHGAREDLHAASYQHGEVHARLLAFFSNFEPDTDWSELREQASDDLDTDLAAVLATMRDNGLQQALCIDMSYPDMPFSVVKVIVCGSHMTIPA